jgi:glycosyltransferase involved in cell wall biosynthesis
MSDHMNSNVTVIIPCYNDGRFLEQAIDSVLNQTTLPQKIIIVDDGSEQETKDVINNLNSPIIEVIFQNNRGVAAARNKGIEAATTDFILTLDADDGFEPAFIKKGLKTLHADPTIGAVCCYYQKHKNNKPFDDVIKPLGGEISDFLVKNNGVASALFRKSCWEEVGGYDTSFSNGYEDWDFWLSILRNNWKMHVIPETLFSYRVKETSRDQTAVTFYDKQLRTAIYNKHKSAYLAHSDRVFLELIYKNNRLIHKVIKVQDTIDYRLGRTILKPLRFVKNLFS